MQADGGGDAMRRPGADATAREIRSEAIRLGREAAKRERLVRQRLEKLVSIRRGPPVAGPVARAAVLLVALCYLSVAWWNAAVVG